MTKKTVKKEKETFRPIKGTDDDIGSWIDFLCDCEGIEYEEAQFRLFLDSCAVLYGNLSVGDAYKIYTEDYKVKITKKKFAEFVKRAQKSLFGNMIRDIVPLSELFRDAPKDTPWNQEIIHSEMFRNEDREPIYYKISAEKRHFDKPFKILPWAELVEYRRGDFVQDYNGEYYDKAFDFLNGLGFSTERKIQNFLGRLVYNTHFGKNLLTFLKKDPFYKDLIRKVLEEGQNLEAVNEALSLLQDAINNTRTVANNGYTPGEMRKICDKAPKNEDKNEEKRIVFTKRMEKEIRDGRIDDVAFTEIVGMYPKEARLSAWEEYWRVRNGETKK